MQLSVKSTDETTQLVMLKVADGQWTMMSAVKVADEPQRPFPTLFAVTIDGPMEAELVSTERLGVMSSNRRVVPLMELKFAAPISRIGGSPIFTSNGELAGVLNATLSADESEPVPVQQATRNSNQTRPKTLPSQLDFFGPTGLSVGYAIGMDALSRVVEGFKSPTHQVTHAAIGVLLIDNKDGGAEIKDVSPGGAAAKSGLRPGDVIVEVAGWTVRNQIDYAKIMFRQRAGQTIELRIRRNDQVQTVKVTPQD